MKQLRLDFDDKVFHPTFGKDTAVFFLAGNIGRGSLVLSKSLVPDKESFDDAYYFLSHSFPFNPLIINSLVLLPSGEFKKVQDII